MSITELAEGIGDSQQTVSLICSGITKRTRLSRVRGMAELFGLPPEWLMGRMKQLPGIASGFSGAHIHSEAGDADHPAAWQLAISKWETLVDAAYTRDNRANRRTRLEHFMRERFALAFLIHPGMWRDLLFESPDWRNLDENADPVDEGTQVRLGNFMVDALQPWLDGKAKLNYRNLLYIFGGIADGAIAHLKTHKGWRTRFAKDGGYDAQSK